jgi:flagellar basal-body rod protein FlgB
MRRAKFAYRGQAMKAPKRGRTAMAISDLPIFSMLRTRMNWHQERQRLLAENVANADTPGYRPRDLTPLDFGRQVQQASGQLQLALTAPGHLAGAGGTGAGGSFGVEGAGKYDVKPMGNAENLEDEMMKVAANQMDHQAAISLYARSMGLLKTAIGKR